MATSSAATPLAAPAFDVERGEPQTSESQEEDFPKAYYIVYAFSLCMLLIGTWAFFFPFSESSIVGSILGVWGLVTGLFLILNADLLVTYLRLMREMGRFKKENQRYRASLKQQKKEVKHLREIEKALARMGRMLGGKMESFDEELKELVTNSRDGARRIIDGVLLITRPKQSDVRAGKDLESVNRVISGIYARPFADINMRFKAMMKGLADSPRWQKVQSMSIDRLKFVIESVLFEDLSKVQGIVRSKVDEEETSVPQAQENKPSEVLEADDPWADAMAFVEGQ